MHISDLVFDEESGSDVAALVREHNVVVPIGWLMFLTIGPSILLWWQYRRLAP